MLATLFLVSALITRRTGTVSLHRMGGLLRTAPWLAVLFAVPALTLAGIPPTAGFVAKLALLRAGAGAGPGAVVAIGVIVLASLLTLVALVRVWVQVFWHEPAPRVPDADPSDEVDVGTARTPVPMYVATAGLVAVSLGIAVLAGPLSALTARAGEDLVGREPYRVAVLGDGAAR